MKIQKWLMVGLSVISVDAWSQGKVIKIDGSSTVFPITEAVAEEFQKVSGGTRVTVGISGTGGGFKKFCRAEIDIQGASRPILKEEMETCKKAGVSFFEIPVAYDALTVVVHPSNNWMKEADLVELKKIWEPGAQAKITKWDHVNQKWPKQDLRLFGAGSDSGTFDFFTEAVVGKAKSSRGDYTASEDDNTLVQGVSQDKNSLAYLPYAYFEANKATLKALPIKTPSSKKAVPPSIETVKSGAYPLARPLFVYVSAKSFEKDEVKKFMSFYLKNVGDLATQVKYIPLPTEAYQIGEDHLKKKRLGTVFGGHQSIGLTLDELLKKEASM